MWHVTEGNTSGQYPARRELKALFIYHRLQLAALQPPLVFALKNYRKCVSHNLRYTCCRTFCSREFDFLYNSRCIGQNTCLSMFCIQNVCLFAVITRLIRHIQRNETGACINESKMKYNWNGNESGWNLIIQTKGFEDAYRERTNRSKTRKSKLADSEVVGNMK